LVVEERAAITEVLGGSSSADAGLVVGDIVIAVDGQPITTRDELLESIEIAGVDATIVLTVLRDPQRSLEETEIAVTIGAR
jgi:S1-C subfamily serine protease